jgi:2-dehydro-3-deoxyphosphogalactonate aldolase
LSALPDPPLIAILRGVTPAEAPAIARALIEGGFACLEVPLNSPSPLESIAAIRAGAGGQMRIGAGTVLMPGQIADVAAAGAQFVVSPNTDPAVIAAAKAAGLACLPGVFTASEAFAALAAGADALKLFPAEAASPAMLKALLAILPQDTAVLPVGGITSATLRAWRDAGASGFGVGSALYRPGARPDQVKASAESFVAAWRG